MRVRRPPPPEGAALTILHLAHSMDGGGSTLSVAELARGGAYHHLYTLQFSARAPASSPV